MPIIALTADVQKGMQEQCRTAGMDDYLSKPFDQDVLQTVLRKWLPENDRPVKDLPLKDSPATIEALKHALDTTNSV